MPICLPAPGFEVYHMSVTVSHELSWARSTSLAVCVVGLDSLLESFSWSRSRAFPARAFFLPDNPSLSDSSRIVSDREIYISVNLSFMAVSITNTYFQGNHNNDPCSSNRVPGTFYRLAKDSVARYFLSPSLFSEIVVEFSSVPSRCSRLMSRWLHGD